MSSWDEEEFMPPSLQPVWTPYNGYRRNNLLNGSEEGKRQGKREREGGRERGGGGEGGWGVDQVRNVRRVPEEYLERFRT
eukprot:2480095-Rhodomonas_salina.1